MSLFIEIVRAIFYLAVLAGASELLAKGAEILEHKFGAGFVGSVILGFVTMLPELVFVLVAVRAGETEVALGSAVGGNILLFTIGLGLVILIAFWKHRERIQLSYLIRDDLLYLFVSAMLLLFMSLDGEFSLFDGVVLTAMYVIFVIHQYWETRKYADGIHPNDLQKPKTKKEEHAKDLNYKKNIALFIVGSIGILWAAEPFVEAIVEISVSTGVSALFLALVISPIAAEMPEKISALILTKRSMTGAEMAVANFVGSKIQANTLLFGGMIVYYIFLNQQPLPIVDTFVDIIVAILTTIVGIYVLMDLKLHRKEGIVITILYAVSVLFLYFK